MDSDDIADPSRLEVQCKYMIDNPDVDILGSWVRIIEEDKLKKFPKNHKEIKKLCPYRNPVAHSTIFMKKNAIVDVGGYPNLRKCQDWALWGLMLKNKKKFSNIDNALIHYRLGENFAERRNFNYLINELNVIKYFYNIRYINLFTYLLTFTFRVIIRIITIVLNTKLILKK